MHVCAYGCMCVHIYLYLYLYLYIYIYVLYGWFPPRNYRHSFCFVAIVLNQLFRQPGFCILQLLRRPNRHFNRTCQTTRICIRKQIHVHTCVSTGEICIHSNKQASKQLTNQLNKQANTRTSTQTHKHGQANKQTHARTNVPTDVGMCVRRFVHIFTYICLYIYI